MLRAVRIDLHIHTCLSPCCNLEMTPKAIVETCRQRAIDVIAICDHNSAENIKGVKKAAKNTSLTILAGMEVTTREEVHILGVFDEETQVLELQKEVYAHLMEGENNDVLFGLQVVANEHDEVVNINKRFLIGGTDFSLRDLVESIHRLRGLAIASHVDREAFGLIGQLGMIPENLKLDALEVSAFKSMEQVQIQVGGSEQFPIVTASDAHRLSEIGRAGTTFLVAENSVEEICKGLRGIEGRKIIKGGFSLC